MNRCLPGMKLVGVKFCAALRVNLAVEGIEVGRGGGRRNGRQEGWVQEEAEAWGRGKMG